MVGSFANPLFDLGRKLTKLGSKQSKNELGTSLGTGLAHFDPSKIESEGGVESGHSPEA